ncbi:MAG: site-specific integrase, partial [Lachnospiraceae bacterium]|nr:site-specific integrase [Lachnospiraceae bacterium]
CFITSNIIKLLFSFIKISTTNFPLFRIYDCVIQCKYGNNPDKGVNYMQSNKTCKLVEQYLAYLVTIKGRSKNTILEYRLDLLQFFHFVDVSRCQEHVDFQYVNIDFINLITLGDMYAFLADCQDTLHLSPGTRTRKIVSIRQFWKYLKTKAHLINNNIAEELETPKQPKRIVRCLTLEESVRLLI